MTLAKLIAKFVKEFGRKPQGMEMIRLRQMVKKQPAEVIPFPKEKITDWTKPRPDVGPLLKDSPEAIAKIKAENKAAIKRLKDKKKTVEDFRDDGDWDPSGMASGGIARVGMMIGGFTKAKVLIQMLENTLKGSKDPYVKKTFPNFIKELKANPELANNENVWKNLTTGLPKNQRLIVHSDDSVDFFRQTEFGPHNIERTLEFQKTHNLSRDQANTILRMEPEDRILEMKRLEIERAKNIAEKNLKGMEQESQLLDFDVKDRTKQALGGRASLMYGGDPGFAFEYGGSWADWHDQHRDQMPVEQYIKTKLPKHRLPFREMQSGGLAYMLGEPTYMKYGAGGSVGHAPWHKPTGQQATSRPTSNPQHLK